MPCRAMAHLEQVNTLSDVKKKTLYLQYMLNRIYSK